MQELKQLLAGEEDAALDLAAAQIAQIVDPGHSSAWVLNRLDDLAENFEAQLPSASAEMSGPDFVAALNAYLFDELRFTGDTATYYDPQNSFLHQVLQRRSGMPITLSVIYIEIARRLGRRVFGIGLPGHFIVEYVDAHWRGYIDPFHGGKVLSRREAVDVVKQATGIDLTPAQEQHFFQPASKREIVMRMLRNLQGMYVRAREFEKGLAVAAMLREDGGEKPHAPAPVEEASEQDRRRSKARWN